MNDFQLPQVERAAVSLIPDTVRRDHEAVLHQCDAPAEKHHKRQREFAEPAVALQPQMAVPSESHEHIRHNQKHYCIYSSHIIDFDILSRI